VETLHRNLKRKFQVVIDAWRFGSKESWSALLNDLFASAKDDNQNVRDNNAAWVAGPGRICFYNGPPPTA
jgi:hypothetical protein